MYVDVLRVMYSICVPLSVSVRIIIVCLLCVRICAYFSVFLFACVRAAPDPMCF